MVALALLGAAATARAAGSPADSEPVLIAAAEVRDAASSTRSVGAADLRAAAPACLVRDPDDGACYPTADAADRAWLSRGATPNVLAGAVLAARLEDDEDEGEEDAEDGGGLAPVDTLLPRGRKVPSVQQLLTPEKRSFWKSLAKSFKNLVVRKSDSRPASIPEDEMAALFATEFPLPIEDFSTAKFRDSFNSPRGRHRRHHAIDLPAPRGTPVVAVVDGTVERLGRDRKGGKVCYLRDASGRFIFYYAHLAKHAEGLKAGDVVKRGQRLGDVGSTGHATGPHLHFAIFRESESETAWNRLVVNPYLVFSTLLK